jgi:Ca2+-binding EF-hand superfamily protein
MRKGRGGAAAPAPAPPAKGKKRGKEKAVDPDVAEAFNLFAENEQLDAQGLKLALSALGVEKSEEEAVLLFSASKGMGVREFARIAQEQPKTRDDAAEAWDLFDEDGKGFVVRADLVRVANELQEHFSEADLDGMLKLAENGDGIVTRDSFLSFLRAAGV